MFRFVYRNLAVLSLVAALAVPTLAQDPPLPGQGPPSIEDLIGLGGQAGAQQEAKFWAELVTDDKSVGKTAYLLVHAELPLDHYIYALDESFSGHTEIKILKTDGLEPIDASFVPEKKPKVKFDEIFDQEIGKHHDMATWIKRYRITDLKAAVSGELTGQFCVSGPGGACTPIRPPAKLEAVLTVDEETTQAQVALYAALRDAGEEPAAAGSPPGNAAATPDAPQIDAEPVLADDDPRKEGMFAFIAIAIGAGFLALLTPCVFPMVPITVSFFLKQAESGGKPLRLAVTYCLGIIGTFTLLGLLMSAFFGATKMNAVANNPWLNVFIAGVLIFFGANLLGMFEIRVPSWLVNYTGSRRGQGGFLGTIFMAVTFTLVSFTCTFAFVGGLLALAAQGEYYWATIGMLAFSAAFALPFFFLALFPAFLKKLPKSGGWMNTVKVTLGLIEIGAAFKFLSTADLAWNPVPVIFDYSLVMTAWMITAALTGVYLLGFFRLPHDDKVESISVLRFAFAATFVGLAAYLAGGLFGRTEPTGVLWSQIAALAPPHFETDVAASGGHGSAEPDDTPGPRIRHSGLSYALNYNVAQEYAQRENKLLFLDFTGVNCPNCRLMEKDVMPKGEIPDLLRQFVRVQLYTDNVPLIEDEDLVDSLLQLNRNLQEDWFKDVTLPAYAVVTPDGKTVLSALKGYDPSITRFKAFLEKGISKWGSAEVAQADTQSAH